MDDSNSSNCIAAGDKQAVDTGAEFEQLTQYVQTLLQQMQERFQATSEQVLSKIDEMGHRIDDLERNIADLMAQAGVEEK